MSTLFISDLHLDASHPTLGRLFAQFLRNIPDDCEALYILGDLFEVWLGDDDARPEVTQFVDLLRETTAKDIPVYVLHGNRDFLLGEKFCADTGCQLIQQNTVIDLYGQRTLLCHGDSLCTDDEAHQKFRALVLSDAWKNDFLSKPFAERVAIAQGLRDKSREETRQKPEAIIDVNQSAVEALMRENQVNHMIHGHTHRPALHEFDLDGQSATRLVLSDWDETGSYLNVSAAGYQVQDIILDDALQQQA